MKKALHNLLRLIWEPKGPLSMPVPPTDLSPKIKIALANEPILALGLLPRPKK